MNSYDLCLAWNWEYDVDFVRLLETTCQQYHVSLLQITPEKLTEIMYSLENQQMSFKVFWDRASENDARFIPIVRWALHNSLYFINHHERASLTWDKSAMHYILINAGLLTPYTIILPPFNDHTFLPDLDLSPLGGRFIIKPAHGGGGEGVVIEATSLQQVIAARQEYPSDRYLLQAYITPVYLAGRAAWFRVLYSSGRIYPFWWDTHSHVYSALTLEEESSYYLAPLRDVTSSIARVCGLDLFSTEIALTAENRFVIVDYVNDQIDLRLQSKAIDGVPDEIVVDIIHRQLQLVNLYCSPAELSMGKHQS